jgi:hypothetical protein
LRGANYYWRVAAGAIAGNRKPRQFQILPRALKHRRSPHTLEVLQTGPAMEEVVQAIPNGLGDLQ